MKRSASISILLLALAAPALAADMGMGGMAMGNMAHEQSATAAAVGVVKAVDQARGVVTISHEPIKSLGWSAMTMDFVVDQPELLKKLNPGKKVHFQFREHGDDYLITAVD